jgi:hypothetical protein
MEAMPSSGVRIGKVLAVFGPNVEPAAPTVAVTHLWSVFLAPGSYGVSGERGTSTACCWLSRNGRCRCGSGAKPKGDGTLVILR